MAEETIKTDGDVQADGGAQVTEALETAEAVEIPESAAAKPGAETESAPVADPGASDDGKGARDDERFAAKGRELRTFLLKLAIFAVGFLFVSAILQYIVDNGLRKTQAYLFAEWNDLYGGKIDADLLILGSSRAYVHFNPATLEKELGVKAYNLGLNGHGFHTQNCRFQAYLRHNPKPKYLIVSVDLYGLKKNDSLYRNEQFLPYLWDPLIQQCTKGIAGAPTYWDVHLPFYKYYSRLELVRIGVHEFFGIRHYTNPKYKGYEGQNREWDGWFDTFKKINRRGIMQPIEPTTYREFRDFLAYCKREKIKVFMVYSPEYHEVAPLYLNRSQIFTLYRNLSKEYDAEFLDYSGDPLGLDKSLFYNSQHLKKEGAEIFSAKLARDLAPYVPAWSARMKAYSARNKTTAKPASRGAKSP